ncbi:hypothetical protein H5410_027865 [Solanum commersonii]|uniref:Transposase-associated domain-containing protein n=1 Tax=Solanum commersonii TaxID=4109 RepID=A0A9J5Z2E8_SOLCO|nr:hypothetical protein H5410_027865 [Solanum commersonii]
MHYETGVGLKPEFIDCVRNFIEHTMTHDIFKNNGLVRCPCNRVMVHVYRNGFKPIYFIWIDHGESDRLDDMFYKSMSVDVYNMVAPYGQIKVEHSLVVHYVKGVCILPCQLQRNRTNRNDEGDIDPLFPSISIFNQNGRGSKKHEKRGFIDILSVNTWGNKAIYTKFSKWLRNYFQTEEVSRNKKINNSVDVKLETTLQQPQHILEEVSDDEILNVEEEIFENEENESFDDEEWDDNENETTEEEEWENDENETSEEEYDRHHKHLRVSQTKHAKKKKSKRPIDSEDIAGSISSALERISHDTLILVVPFGTADPQQYYPNYCQLVGVSSTSQAVPSVRYEDLPLHAIRRGRPLSAGTPSPTGASPQLSTMRITDSSSEKSDAMAGTSPLTQRYVHPDVSPSSTTTPSATPDEMLPLVPGQKDRLGGIRQRILLGIKDCVRRLYTQAYHSWVEIPNSICQAMFNNFKELRHNHVRSTTFERKASARLYA